MKKNLLFFCAFIIFFVSCEKDDFCIDPVTPNLVIGFYDNDLPDEHKKSIKLSVWASGKELLYDEISVDSILVPLNPAEDFTVFYLESDGVLDSITINYIRNEVFVSRSCGFKYNFEDLNLTDVTNNWILNTEVTNQTVEDETEHIKILH